MKARSTISWYDDVEIFQEFAHVVDPSIYRPLPDDWRVGISDVVRSRDAVGAGRYRAVNMAGASVISAVTNALGGKAFPFVFAGDGAHFAIPPDDTDTACEAMTKSANWARRELDLDLRVGMASVGKIREAGFDVTVARYAASSHADYAMFSGGGLEWAEEQVKAGHFKLDPGPADAMPDLTGLSCQWGAIASQNGVVLSIIVKPANTAPASSFAALSSDILSILEESDRLNPVPPEGPKITWPADRLGLQARTTGVGEGPAFLNMLRTMIKAAIAWILFRTGLHIGSFDPDNYRRQMTLNTDYRKYDDGLIMTVDCTEETVQKIESRLEEARRKGVADYGLHRQKTAVMTCVAPSILRDDHLHFLDGGDGGYTRAAQQMNRATT